MFKILHYFTIISLLSLPMAMQSAGKTTEDLIQESKKQHLASLKTMRYNFIKTTIFVSASILSHNASQKATNTTCYSYLRNACIVESVASAFSFITNYFSAMSYASTIEDLEEQEEQEEEEEARRRLFEEAFRRSHQHTYKQAPIQTYTNPTYYEILGVQKEASNETIRNAYKTLVLRFHPDKNPNGEAQFKQIQTAYENLKDPVKRGEYNATLMHRF